MGWPFGKKQQSPATSSSVEDLWQWWNTAQPRITQALAERTISTLVPEISAQVNAVGPGLAWELARGQQSQHAFVITAEGDPERWAVGMFGR